VTGDEARRRLAEVIASGQLIVGAGAGTGLSAVCAEEGGADFLVIYNSGRFRMAGRGSLAGLMPFGDANAIVVDMAREVLPVVRRTPVLAGVCGTDPFRSMPRFLAELRALGFAGVQNFPTVALYDGMFRQGLEETGMGYELEVEMVRAARDLGLLTVVYCVTDDEARSMAGVPADLIVAHVGLTTKGRIGARSAMTLDEAAARVQEVRDAVAAVNPTIPVLCHGGPIAEVDDVRYVLARTTGLAGFLGASSMERLPTEDAITETVRRFKALAANG
jgi:predicted TIM-barrel enzyme